ncbi:MAG: 1-acyl-sn-glycerol-3-phosphate acyltransferase [Nitrosomonas sp.]|nr:1-acyl-sn-glycerol-3-phosphate acyltransferase [Nitrosomonas sp.]
MINLIRCAGLYLRLGRLFVHLAVGLLKSFVYPYLNKTRQQQVAAKWAQQFLRILHVDLRIRGTIPSYNQSVGLLVANHTSWLDILVLLTVLPVRFVAKDEIRGWPLIGGLCERAGTLFIHREKRSDALRVNRQIADLLQSGRFVTVFPEGMTGDGTVLHHFHASLLQPVIHTQTRLYPVAIQYSLADDGVSRHTAYVDISIFQSLLKILRQPYTRAELVFCEPIACHNQNRRELARLAEQTIAHMLAVEIRHMEPEKPCDIPGEPQ